MHPDQPSARKPARQPAPKRRPRPQGARAQCDTARGLGTRLRHLLELLDGDVQSVYRDAGLPDYRPRYTPVMRALADGEATLTAIAAHAGSTHSAISQTVALMQRAGLVQLRSGVDARERVAALTPAARRRLPKLQSLWADTAAAADALDAELPVSLAAAVEAAIVALERASFRARIAARRARRAPGD